MSDKYSSLYELGAGAFGTAWVVEERATGNKHVSKVIQMKGLSNTDVDRCITEVAVLSACRHDNIVRYIQAFISAGALNIIMEFAEGGDLAQKIIKQNGTYFQKEVVIDWFLQVMMALNYIHGRNILHRDLKPQNIFLTASGVVKLGDFGIARVLCGVDDLASTRIGTPFYISPEICRGERYNSSSDMWAAGCLLYEMCCLRVPFRAANMDQLMARIVQADYPPIPSHFGEVIPGVQLKLFKVNPANRFSARDILKLKDFSAKVSALNKRNFEQKTPKRSRSFTRGHLQCTEGQRSSSANRVLTIKHAQKRSSSASEKGHGNERNENKHSDLALADRVDRKGVPNSSESMVDLKKDRPENLKHPLPRTENKVEKYENKQAVCVNNGKAYGNDSETQVNKEGGTINGQDSIAQSQDKLGHTEKNNSSQSGPSPHGLESKDTPVRKSYSYTIKDSVARKLSEASPKLSEIIRRQRISKSFAGSMNSPPSMSVCKKGENSCVTDEEFCEVFSPDIEDNHQSIDSSTYKVYKKPVDLNNNNP